MPSFPGAPSRPCRPDPGLGGCAWERRSRCTTSPSVTPVRTSCGLGMTISVSTTPVTATRRNQAPTVRSERTLNEARRRSRSRTRTKVTATKESRRSRLREVEDPTSAPPHTTAVGVTHLPKRRVDPSMNMAGPVPSGPTRRRTAENDQSTIAQGLACAACDPRRGRIASPALQPVPLRSPKGQDAQRWRTRLRGADALHRRQGP